MKRILIGLAIGLLLLEAARRLHRPADEAAAAGVAAYEAGDYARAEARFRQAVQGATDPAGAAANHAAALYRLERFGEADRAYERAADGDALRTARAAYDRGNCALSEATRAGGTADRGLLERAAEQYEACLGHEGSTPAPGSLFADARHNLELAKLLLADQKGADPSQPEQECPL
jgi:tetratricopeptide (TPR) repeat protein